MSNKNEIHRAYELGQSFWLDFIRRDLVEDGELASLIEADEIRGITSNPSIFKQAIGDSDLYLTAMRPMAHAGWGSERIFETLAIDDIRAATDLLLPLYEGTDGGDGFVSIEVNPEFAADTQKTLEEARRLWETVNRANLMVKIPATQEGVPAIENAIFEGININVTLIFSLDRYSEVMEAYIKGLERRTAGGESVERVASVASFFISRVDSAVDGKLEAIVRQEGPTAERAHALLGKAAIANAKLAYAQFKSVFNSERFERLRESGARVQRPLWASTSTKNPAYPDVLYVDELIGLYTVNTLPPKTLDAFREHGKAEDRLEVGLSDARAQLEALEALNISLNEITLDLEQDGVRAFADAYASLIETVEKRAEEMRNELGGLHSAVARYLEHLDSERVAPRFWRVDPDLWPETKGGTVIKMRLDWLEATFDSYLDELKQFEESIDTTDFGRVGWINSGFARDAIVEAVDESRTAVFLDTLDPAELRRFSRQTPVESTLFVAESRSNIDPGVMARLSAVWQRAYNRVGDAVRKHFVVLASPGSRLAEWSEGNSVEFISEWNFGSGVPVSASGLLQAALLGAEPQELVSGARRMKELCMPGAAAALNPSLYLGALLAAGKNIYLVADSTINARADWIAKYVRARIGLALHFGLPENDDATVIYLRTDGALEGRVFEHSSQGGSIAILQSEPGLAGIGEEAVRWEVGAAVAAFLLKESTYAEAPILPAAERLSRMLARQEKKGSFGFPKPNMELDDASIWWSGGGPKRGEIASLDQVADLVVDKSREGGSLFVGSYQAQSRRMNSAISDLGESMSVVSAFGRLPEVKLINGLPLLVACAPQEDHEVPGLNIGFGELQLASMIADFEQIRESGQGACAIFFKNPAGSTDFLRNLASWNLSVTSPSAENGETILEGER